MARRKEYDNSTITFTLTRAGCREGSPVTLTGKEFSDLGQMVKRRKPKVGPKTEPQAQTAALFEDFVRGGLR